MARPSPEKYVEDGPDRKMLRAEFLWRQSVTEANQVPTGIQMAMAVST